MALHDARQKIHALFWDSANAVRSEFTRHLDRYRDDFYGQLLAENEKQMNELERVSITPLAKIQCPINNSAYGRRLRG